MFGAKIKHGNFINFILVQYSTSGIRGYLKFPEGLLITHQARGLHFEGIQ